jgi:hypothetical protein
MLLELDWWVLVLPLLATTASETAIPYDATVGSLRLTSTASPARLWMLGSPAASVDDGATATLIAGPVALGFLECSLRLRVERAQTA